MKYQTYNLVQFSAYLHQSGVEIVSLDDEMWLEGHDPKHKPVTDYPLYSLLEDAYSIEVLPTGNGGGYCNDIDSLVQDGDWLREVFQDTPERWEGVKLLLQNAIAKEQERQDSPVWAVHVLTLWGFSREEVETHDGTAITADWWLVREVTDEMINTLARGV